MRISIAVCTAGRPELLRACLELIIAQEGPPGSELRLIVVDNNQLPDAEPIAAEIAGKGRFPVHYVHESRLGIPFARNRAIDTALALKSDWIAFIDDDHEATPGWLSGLIQAARKHRADVVQGRLIKLYPHRLPLFAVATQLAQVKEGEALATASTHSVAFASWLVRPDKAATAFRRSLALLDRDRLRLLPPGQEEGGEDRRHRRLGGDRARAGRAAELPLAVQPRASPGHQCNRRNAEGRPAEGGAAT